ncbi:hypothetical protein D3C81_751270 [compost metagenome]
MVQPHVGQQRPGLAIVAIHRDRLADLIQWRQQVAACGIDTGIDIPSTELLALGQDTGSLVTVDGEVQLPQPDRQQAAHGSDGKPGDQQPALAARNLDVVASQTRLRVDHALEQLLGKIDGLATGGLDLGGRWQQLIGLAGFVDEGVDQRALLIDR